MVDVLGQLAGAFQVFLFFCGAVEFLKLAPGEDVFHADGDEPLVGLGFLGLLRLTAGHFIALFGAFFGQAPVVLGCFGIHCLGHWRVRVQPEWHRMGRLGRSWHLGY